MVKVALSARVEAGQKVQFFLEKYRQDQPRLEIQRCLADNLIETSEEAVEPDGIIEAKLTASLSNKDHTEDK